MRSLSQHDLDFNLFGELSPTFETSQGLTIASVRQRIRLWHIPLLVLLGLGWTPAQVPDTGEPERRTLGLRDHHHAHRMPQLSSSQRWRFHCARLVDKLGDSWSGHELVCLLCDHGDV